MFKSILLVTLLCSIDVAALDASKISRSGWSQAKATNSFSMDDGFMLGKASFDENEAARSVNIVFAGRNRQTSPSSCNLKMIALTGSSGFYSNSFVFAHHVTKDVWVVVTKDGWDSEGICGVNTYLDGTYKR